MRAYLEGRKIPEQAETEFKSNRCISILSECQCTLGNSWFVYCVGPS